MFCLLMEFYDFTHVLNKYVISVTTLTIMELFSVPIVIITITFHNAVVFPINVIYHWLCKQRVPYVIEHLFIFTEHIRLPQFLLVLMFLGLLFYYVVFCGLLFVFWLCFGFSHVIVSSFSTYQKMLTVLLDLLPLIYQVYFSSRTLQHKYFYEKLPISYQMKHRFLAFF